MLALGVVTGDREQAVGDPVDGEFEPRHRGGQPGDEIVGTAFEHRTVAVDRVVPVQRADQREIAAVDPAAIAHDEIVKRDAGECVLGPHAAALLPARRPKKVQSARLIPDE